MGGRHLALAAALPVTTTFGMSAVPVVLDDAVAALDVSRTTAAWLLVGYMLAFGVATPVMGKLSDIRGSRTLLLLGTVLLAVGSVLCLASDGFEPLLVARVVLGVGAAATATAGFTIIAGHPDAGVRVRVLGLLTAGSCAALGAGALVGGAVAAAGWRYALALPLMAGVLGLAALRGPAVRGLPSRRFDATGAVLVAVFAASALLVLQQLAEAAWTGPTAALAASALLSGVLLAGHLVRRPDGFLPIVVLRQRRLSLATLAAAGLSASSVGTVLAAPLMLQDARPNWTESQVGAVLVPAALFAAVAAISSARWPPERAGEQLLTIVTAAVLVCGLLGSAAGGAVGSTVALAAGITGFAASQVMVLGRLPELVPGADVGIAIGALSLAVILGGALGTTVAAVVTEAATARAAVAALAVFPLAALLAAGAGQRMAR